MLSARLVQLIEEQWERIAQRLIGKIRRHPDMPLLAARPNTELRQWCQDILINLGSWLSATQAEELRRRYEVVGRLRFEESIPLHEAVLRLQFLKDEIIEFIHEQGFTLTSLELYQEEELEHRVNRFFDALIYHVVRGYERAMRVAVRAAS